jgi:hypothetical protein
MPAADAKAAVEAKPKKKKKKKPTLLPKCSDKFVRSLFNKPSLGLLNRARTNLSHRQAIFFFLLQKTHT